MFINKIYCYYKMNTQNMVDKTYEKLQDFNLVYLAKFEKIATPDKILGSLIKRFPAKVEVRNFLFGKKLIDNPEVPSEAIIAFNSGADSLRIEDIVYTRVVESDGNVYFDSYKDLSENFNYFINSPEINNTIKEITRLLGKSIMSKDLLSLPGFKIIESNVYGDASLSLNETSDTNEKVRTCNVVITIVKDSLPITINIGTISYNVYGRR